MKVYILKLALVELVDYVFLFWMHYGSDCKFVKYNDHLDGLLYLYK